MHMTIHHPTEKLVKMITACKIEGDDPGVRYTIRAPHTVHKRKLVLVDGQDRELAVMTHEGFLPGSTRTTIIDAQGNSIGHVKSSFTGVDKCVFIGRNGEIFQYKTDLSGNVFSWTSSSGGVSIRPESKLQLDTKRLDVDITHSDHILMLCFCIFWLRGQMAISNFNWGQNLNLTRRNIPWGEPAIKPWQLYCFLAIGLMAIAFFLFLYFI